jgi:hypothetical protein
MVLRLLEIPSGIGTPNCAVGQGKGKECRAERLKNASIMLPSEFQKFIEGLQTRLFLSSTIKSANGS